MAVPLDVIQPPQVRKAALPVDPNWKCCRSGDCCTLPEVVVMTEQEQQVLQEFADKNFTIKRLGTIHWTPAQSGFVHLQAAPCPMLDYINGVPTCSVHPIRPYTCRRFGCMRPDPKSEPLQLAPLSPYLHYGNIGCSNIRQRLLESRVARRMYDLMQRRARQWAIRHGWKVE